MIHNLSSKPELVSQHFALACPDYQLRFQNLRAGLRVIGYLMIGPNVKKMVIVLMFI